MNKILKRILLLTLASTFLLSACPIANFAKAESAPGNIELSRQAATEGMVLLENKNEGLPIANGSTVALFGKGQIDFIKGGGGSGDVNAEYVRNLLQGMQIKENDNKVKIYKPLADAYTANSNLNLTDTMVSNAQKSAETAVVVISRHSGEGSDRNASKGDYYLNDSEVNMLNKINSAGFENVVVVLNIGGIIDTSWIKNYSNIDSVLLAWQPGMEGGLAVADVLCGDVNPSGKLTDTFAKSYDDYPSSATFNESRDYVNYEEDVYVGYRWFETFDKEYAKVNYEFGYGLSYTTFAINNVKAVKDGTNIKVTADVKNTGNVAGKEVVQVYYSAPQGKLGKPAKELAAFAKTKLLGEGEVQTLTMSFAIDDMSSYDDTGKVQKSAYLLEAGDYKIYVGNSIKDAGKKGVRWTYKVDSTVVTEQLTEELTPVQLPKRLLADSTYETLETPGSFGYKIPEEGIFKIEGENYFKKHYHAHVLFSETSNDCGVEMFTSDTKINRWLIYALDVKAAGTYKLTLAASNDKSSTDDSINVYVNDLFQPGVKLPMASTGGKWNIREFGPVNISLDEGINFLKIEFKQGDNYTGVLDYITLEKGEGTGPLEPGPHHTVKADEPTTIEGEDFSTKHDEVGVEGITAGDDIGGQSLKNLHTYGYWVRYSLDVQKAGTYKLSMKIANGLEPTSDGTTVYVNQKKQDDIKLEVPQTSVEGNQYFNFQTFEPGTITLPAGKCTLTYNVNDRMGNIDNFTLTPIDSGIMAVAKKDTETVYAAPAAASVPTKTIMFLDVYNNPSLMEKFIAQLSDLQLAELSHGHGATIPGGTGGIGNLPEFGVPVAETVDGPAGVRLQNTCTAWPVATLLACTWNEELLEEIGKAVAVEVKLNGADVWLAPGMNIHRNPLCGRNFEYYSEDPLVSGKIAAALTRGVQSEKVAVAVKHYAANNKETDRGYSDSRVSERALREIYLKGFEIVVKEADPWSIMSSYNNLNSVETSESYALLTTLLRDEWGFKGIVMSDWWNDSCAFREVKAGNDVKMASGDTPNVMGALKNGLITRAELERNVERILNFIMKTSAMDRKILNPEYEEIMAEGKNIVKAVDYAWKSSGIGTEKCEDTDGGYNPTNTYEGNWLRYNIDVQKAGMYRVTARVASPGGSGKFNIYVNNELAGTVTNTTNTGDWQVWNNSQTALVRIPDGKSDMKLDFIQGGFNINTIEFERVSTDFDIIVSPDSATLKPGASQQYSVEATGSGSDEVNWSVSGADSTNTSIDKNGLLKIAEDETSETITVTAVSKTDVNIFDTARLTVEYDYYELGDVNFDGDITVTDIVALRKIIMSGVAPTEQEIAVGNVDGSEDNKITVADIVALRRMIMS